MEMCVFIVSIYRDSVDEVKGAWMTPPIQREDLIEKFGFNAQFGEYSIPDYELPFEIDEYTSIEEINYLCALAEELLDIFDEAVIYDLTSHYFLCIEDLYEHKDDIIAYPNCHDAEELGKEKLKEWGLLDELPYIVYANIDFDAVGSEIIQEGDFFETKHGMYEYVG